MAAGRGTRLSRKMPGNCKCTLDIGGISLIRHTVEMLINFNIEVHIVVGYNKNQIIDSLRELPVTFHENVFYSITNSLASLWFARNELAEGLIILGNADVYWDEQILSFLLEERRDCVMLSDSTRVEVGDYLFYVEDEKVMTYGKGVNITNANCEYVGITMIQGDMIPKFKQQVCALIESQWHSDWWESALYKMIPHRPIWTKDVAGHFWGEIDFVEDYERILAYRRDNSYAE